MAITELVFTTAKPDPQVRKELDIKLPDALSGVFSEAPQLESLYIGTSLEATEDGSSQDGICLLLKWQDISGFDSLIESAKFAAFKASIFPCFTGPPDIQLYESPEGMPARIAVDSPYLHIMKSHTEAADTQCQYNRTSVEDQWKAFIEQCRLAPSANRSLYSSFNGFGLRKDNGAFLGATLWKDSESIDSTLNGGGVKQHIQQLQDVLETINWDHVVLKLSQVALGK